MKNTGVIRKIDELGRIVIPKEIRKSLNIKDGEDIQIYVEEDNIILKKYQKMLSFKENTQKYLDIINLLDKGTFVITDKESVIASTDISLIDHSINSRVSDLINERKKDSGKNINFGNVIIESYYYLFPIIVDADAIGSIIVLNDSEINEQQILLVKVINILLLSLIS